jgi:hypothetical protein
MTALPIIANMNKAARDRTLTTIGGGVFAPVEVAEAARLLELAPELAEMLEVVTNELAQLHAHHYQNCNGGCPSDAYIKAARAVLARLND